MTLGDLIRSSLRALGVIATSETPTSDMMIDGIEAINVMTESWSAMGLMQVAPTEENLTLVVGKSDYTIGTSGTPDWNTARPLMLIGNPYIIDAQGLNYEVVIIGMDQYDDIGLMTTPGRPEWITYRPDYPNGLIRLFPTPDAAETLHLISKKYLADNTNLTAEINLPSQYLAALKWNLAVEMAPEYQAAANQGNFAVIIERARKTLQIVKNNSAADEFEPVTLNLFRKSSSTYNIYGDTYSGGRVGN
jgi:hypothetical protein